MWTDASGEKGWAVGGGGVVLRYEKGAWHEDIAASRASNGHSLKALPGAKDHFDAGASDRSCRAEQNQPLGRHPDAARCTGERFLQDRLCPNRIVQILTIATRPWPSVPNRLAKRRRLPQQARPR